MMDDCLKYEMLNPYSFKKVGYFWFWGSVYKVMYDESELFTMSGYEETKRQVHLLNTAYNEGYNRHKMVAHFEAKYHG